MEEHKQINQQTKLNTNGKSSSFPNKNFAHTLKTILRLPLVTHERKEKDCSGENEGILMNMSHCISENLPKVTLFL